jgi:hypothetical protein
MGIAIESALMSAALAIGLLLGSGCGGAGTECTHYTDCGPVGDAVCAGGRCTVFSEFDGFGSIKANLSFGRDMYQIAASARMWVLLGTTVDGRRLTCAEIDGAFDPNGPGLNPLQYGPKYIEFVWQSGGTYFPNLLIQLVRPAAPAVFFVEGFSRLQAEGTRTVWGCYDKENPDRPFSVRKDEVVELTVTMVRP